MIGGISVKICFNTRSSINLLILSKMEVKLIDRTTESDNSLLHTAFTVDESPLMDENSNIQDEIRQPYYLETLLFIINEIFKDSFYDKLFDDVDRSCVEKFKNLSG